MQLVNRLILFIVIIALSTACGQNTQPVLPTLQATPTLIPPTTTPIAASSTIGQAQPTLQANAEPGHIRIVHAVADAPDLNVYAGFLSVATNLAFTQLTEPTPLAAGDYPIQIAASGSRPGDTPLFEKTFSLHSNANDIVVVAKQNDQFQLLTFPETVVPLNAEESAITFINAVSGASSISVERDGNRIAEAIPFGESILSSELPSGATVLSFETGSTTPTNYEIELEARQHYTIILGGTPEQVGVALFSSPAPGRTTIRTIHASETTPPVDVYLNADLLADNIEFSRPTNRQAIISGEYTVSVFEADANPEADQPLTSQTLVFEAGNDIGLFLVGSPDQLVIVSYSENLTPTPPGQARIAFLNTLESVATLHVETSGGALPDVPDMGFGQPPEATLLDAQSYNFYLTRAGATEENQTVETVQDVLLEQGTYYLYLVTDRQDDQPVIVSEDVGIDEALAGVSAEELEQGAATMDNPIFIRFINAVADQTPIDFEVNNSLLASRIEYGQGSTLVGIEQPEININAMEAGSDSLLQFSEDTLESGSYTVIAYGPDRSNVQLSIVPDNDLIFDGSSPHLRLINLSANTDTLLGLGFSAQDPTPAAGESIPPNEDLRRSIPAGVQRLVDNIAGGSISSTILMPVGIYDMEIIDSNTSQLATTISNIELERGAHYDVVVYEAADSIRINGFVVPYPAASE